MATHREESHQVTAGPTNSTTGPALMSNTDQSAESGAWHYFSSMACTINSSASCQQILYDNTTFSNIFDFASSRGPVFPLCGWVPGYSAHDVEAYVTGS